MIKKFLVLLVLISTSWAHASRWDKDYWQHFTIKNWEHDKCKLYTTGEIRFRGISNAYHYRLTENFAYKALPFLDFELHYSYILNRAPKNPTVGFRNTSRLEIELNPYFKINDITFKLRNRLELLKMQDISQIMYITRHRASITFPIKNHRFLTGIRISDEFFYNYDINKFNQNRFFPLELLFSPTKKTSFNVYIMIRSLYNAGLRVWDKSLVLGTEIGI